MNKLNKLILLLVVITVVLSLILKVGQFFKQRDYICKDCNVILINMTNLRYDHLSANDYFRPTTPKLDQIAKESLVFNNAFAQASTTLPSGLSIFTSLYPPQHGVMQRYDGSTLSKEKQTLVDLLNRNGYISAAFTGGVDYSPRYGLTGRFLNHYECAPYKGAEYIPPQQYGKFDCSIAKALDWLKQNSSHKFFLFLQGFDAHCPFSQNGGRIYDPNYHSDIDYSSCLITYGKTKPQVKDGKKYFQAVVLNEQKKVLLTDTDLNHLQAIYDEAITSSDAKIGAFLDSVDKMGLGNKTIIVFTSEHGDMFGKYGRIMRGGALNGTFYDDVLHIPLMIKLPKVEPKKIGGLVEQIDIAPTILDLLGIAPPTNFSGKTLFPLIFKNTDVRDHVSAEVLYTPGFSYTPGLENAFPKYNPFQVDFKAIRTKEWKLIKETDVDKGGKVVSESAELYHIMYDKDELHDLSGTFPDRIKTLSNYLN